MKSKRILIIRIGNIGDVLMFTPVIRKLKQIFPDAHIDFVSSVHAGPVVQENKSVDHVFFYRKYKRIGGAIRKFLLERSLARRLYDLCFVFEEHPKYHQFARNIMGRRGVTLGFTSVPPTKYLDHAVDFNFLEQHAIDNALFLLRDYFKVTVEPEDYLMDFFIPQETQDRLKDSLPRWKGAERKYFVIHPGCAESLPLRAWHTPNYLPVIRLLRQQGYRIFITGAKGDKIFIDEIMKGYGNADAGVEVFLDQPLFDTAFLIKNSSGILSSDTGIMHLARAVRAPVLALFGPSNPNHTGCIGPGQYIQIRNDFKCGPCHYFPQYRYEDKKDCLHGQPPTCMKSISVEQVTDSLKELLGLSLS